MAGLTRIKSDGIGDNCDLDGSGTLVLDSTNNRVGIGTSAPESLLHIQGPTDAANKARLTISERRNTGTTNWGIDFLRTYDTGGDNQAAGFVRCIRDGGASNAGMVFGIGNQTDTSREKMRINSSGSVFITPSSTGMTRAIAGTNHAHLVVHTDETGTSAYRAIEIGTDVADGLNNGAILCGKRADQTHTPTVIASSWDSSTENIAYFGGGWSTGGAPMTQLRFYTASSYTNGAATGNQVMTINSSGNVGIGTTSPGAGLHLGDTPATAGIQLGTGADFTIKREAGTAGAVFNVGSDLNNYQFDVGNSEKIRIDSSGALLIGSTTAGTHGELLKVEKQSTGTNGAGIKFGGTYSLADDATLSFGVNNACIVTIAENNTGDGGLFFCAWKSSTVVLLADPNGRYAASDTDGKVCVFKSANTGVVTLKNRTGATRSFTIGKLNTSD